MTNYFSKCKTEDEIKATYKSLVKKYHPDVYGDKGNDILKDIHNQLEKVVKKVNTAYSVSDYIDEDFNETEEELALKKELLKKAKKYMFVEGALFALYWQNGLRPCNHRNPLTKHNFSGWNIWTLEIKRLENEYKSCLWSTFAQYKTAKNFVRKGEKSTCITLAIYCKPKKVVVDGAEFDGLEEVGKFVYKSYLVFNVEQTYDGANVENSKEVKKLVDRKYSEVA